MKKPISLLVLLLLIFTSLAGCSSTNEKSEEELRAEVKAELEAEAQMKEELEAEIRAELEADQREKEEIKKLSREELISKQAEYESKFVELLGGLPGEGQIGGVYTADITQFHHYKDNSEFREYVDMLFDLGYGIEQAEGYYYLYVGEPKNYADGEVQTGSGNQGSASQTTQGHQLLEIYETNKEYKLDLNQGQELDTFSVKLSRHPQGYTEDFYLLVNGKRHDFPDLYHELAFGKYKIFDMGSSYVFVVSQADPPHGPNIFRFYYFEQNNLGYLGSVAPGILLTDADIKNLLFSQVTIGNTTYELEW